MEYVGKNFLAGTQKTLDVKEKNDKLDFIKVNLHSSSDTIKKMKRQAID